MDMLEPIDPEEIEKIRQKYEEKIAKAGEEFRSVYECSRDMEIAEAIGRQRQEAIAAGGELGERIRAENEAAAREAEARFAEISRQQAEAKKEERKKSFLGGIFKKEVCVLCGGKTGLLDKKTADGKVCKECTKKLSPWFDDYADSTTFDLVKQMTQIKQDQLDLEKYEFNKIFGEMGVILIDEKNRVFTAFADTSNGLFGEPRDVKSIDDVKDLRPDIIKFDQVTDFDIDIVETTREEKRTENGEQVSYDPPHILYMYAFTLRIKLNHPYIRSVYVPLNKGTVQIKSIGYRKWTDPGRRLAAHLLDLPNLIEEDREAVFDNHSLLEALYHSKYEMPDWSYGFRVTRENWDDIQKYRYYLMIAREIQNSITK